MNIHALTVCVNYADYLAAGLPRWFPHFATWTIVTTFDDHETQAMANRNGLRLHITDAFTRDGATFNKGRAMEEARRTMAWDEWVLLVDADVVPEPGWYDKVVAAKPTPGRIYGAWRRECMDAAVVDDPDLPVIRTDGRCVGYFQLFHGADKALDRRPIFDEHWVHGGIYDCVFRDRWHARDQVMLPIRLTHVGERNNWWGRGNRTAFDAMMDERKRRGGHDHERIPG